jgi:NAD(P)-dependent dehydrogenase (short-subunit alcohol dehydrogenase family)
MAFKPFDLTGKVAVVTGGNGGIGLGMAEGLAQAGADLSIWGSNPDKTAAAGEKLKAYGVRVLTQTVDVGDEAQVVAAMAEVEAKFGRIDTVIANAGVGRSAPSFHEMTTEIWRQNMRVNLDGAFWTLREACKSMVARAKAGDPGGSLMATASLGALQGAARNQAYTATKGALLPMIKGIAVEYARYGIRANAILPGWVATDMTASAQKFDKFNEHVIGRVPSKRWGQPEEFAGVAIYLASDASSFHTGDTLLLDGGYLCY